MTVETMKYMIEDEINVLICTLKSTGSISEFERGELYAYESLLRFLKSKSNM